MSELSCGTRFIGRNETLDQILSQRVYISNANDSAGLIPDRSLEVSIDIKNLLDS